MNDTINFSCSNCGGTQFNVPDDPQPDDPVTCAGCGATGRYEDVQNAMVAQAKSAVEQSMHDILGKAGFKFS